MSPEQLQARKESNIFLTKMLYNRDDGWFDLKHQHLRNVPAHKVEIQILLEQWEKLGRKEIPPPVHLKSEDP
jgi:hypothetical protein